MLHLEVLWDITDYISTSQVSHLTYWQLDALSWKTCAAEKLQMNISQNQRTIHNLALMRRQPPMQTPARRGDVCWGTMLLAGEKHREPVFYWQRLSVHHDVLLYHHLCTCTCTVEIITLTLTPFHHTHDTKCSQSNGLEEHILASMNGAWWNDTS